MSLRGGRKLYAVAGSGRRLDGLLRCRLGLLYGRNERSSRRRCRAVSYSVYHLV